MGGHLLTLGVRAAWDRGAARVWVHTCSLDGAHALRNYEARGFRVYGRLPRTTKLRRDWACPEGLLRANRQRAVRRVSIPRRGLATCSRTKTGMHRQPLSGRARRPCASQRGVDLAGLPASCCGLRARHIDGTGRRSGATDRSSQGDPARRIGRAASWSLTSVPTRAFSSGFWAGLQAGER